MNKLPRKRWCLQFGLRHLLLLLVLTALPCAWFGVKERERKQRDRAANSLEQLGAIIKRSRGGVIGISFDGGRVKDEEWDGELKPAIYIFPSKDPLVIKPGREDFSRFTAFPELTTLDLEGTYFNEENLTHLRELTDLRTLNLNLTPVTDRALSHLATLAELRELHLGGTYVTNRGLNEITPLSNLTILDLSGTEVSDDGLRHLSALKNLATLDLSGTEVSDDGLRELAELKNLIDLDLGDCSITDSGLVQLKALVNLQILRLFGTELTDNGLPQFQEFSNLKQLDLEWNPRISKAGARELRAALPNCIVVHNQGAPPVPPPVD